MSRRGIALFGLVALIPAAGNVAAPAARAGVMVPLCTGDGAAHAVRVPIGGARVPGGGGGDPAGCCVKGCHSGSRKRGHGGAAPGRVDPAQ